MVDYIEISEAETDPEAPSTSSLWKRWAKNWIAGFEGAAGAPRLQNNAIADGVIGAEKLQAGADETAWVANMLLQMPIDRVNGPPVLLSQPASTNAVLTAGASYAGSGLRYAISGLLTAPAGTWVCLVSVNSGSFNSSNTAIRSSYFRRVA